MRSRITLLIAGLSFFTTVFAASQSGQTLAQIQAQLNQASAKTAAQFDQMYPSPKAIPPPPPTGAATSTKSQPPQQVSSAGSNLSAPPTQNANQQPPVNTNTPAPAPVQATTTTQTQTPDVAVTGQANNSSTQNYNMYAPGSSKPSSTSNGATKDNSGPPNIFANQ